MTKQAWYPKASRVQDFTKAYPGSAMNPNVAVIHTTETYGWPGYGGGKTAPNMTIGPNFKTKTVEYQQHFAANRSSRALENRAGGVETNTLNAFQFELIATCDLATHAKWAKQGKYHIYMPEAPDWFLAGVADALVWLHEQWTAFPLVDGAPRGWKAYPASYGTSASQRMTFKEWNASRGIVGHQHVPENSHGDPGAFPIARVLELAKPKPEPEPDPEPEPTPEPVPVPELPTGTWWDRLIAAIVEALKRLGYTPNPTPEPEPEPSPDPAKDACFRLGYGNLQMGYTYGGRWTKEREKASADYMRAMGCSVYAIVEAHEENGMVDKWLAHWPDHFRLAKGASAPDGNGAVYDSTKHRLISDSTIELGPTDSPRRATRFNFEHIATGVRWWLVVPHLTAGNALTRQGQAKKLFAGVDTLHRAVIAGDLNNYAIYPGSPMSQAKANGWADAPTVAKQQADMDRWGSHHGSKAGKNVDHFLIRTLLDLVTVDRLRMHPTGTGYGDLTDHNWLSATITVRHPDNA